MDLSLDHFPRITSLLAIVGFALLVAGLDFFKRRLGYRALVEVMPAPASPTIPSNAHEPEPSAPPPSASAEMGQPPELPRSSAISPSIGRPAKLSDPEVIVAPRLPLGDFLPFPKPGPKVC